MRRPSVSVSSRFASSATRRTSSAATLSFSAIKQHYMSRELRAFEAQWFLSAAPLSGQVVVDSRSEHRNINNYENNPEPGALPGFCPLANASTLNRYRQASAERPPYASQYRRGD